MELLTKIQGPVFEKTAARSNLSDNPATYPSELLALLYKQHPFLGRYQVNLQVKGQDDSLGYMYGVFMVTSADEVPSSAAPTYPGQEVQNQPKPQDPNQVLRVPVIVAEKKAYSFDVFIDPQGKFYPLNEQRVAAALFEASPYVVAPAHAAQNSSTAAGSSNFDPAVPGSGYAGGRSTPAAQLTKAASVFEGLAIKEAAAEKLAQRIRDTPELRTSVWQNKAFKDSLTKLASAASGNEDVVKTASSTLGKILEGSDVVSLKKEAAGYFIMGAGYTHGKTVGRSITNAEAEQLPLEMRQAAINDGYVILTKEAHAPLEEVAPVEKIAEVTESGIYAVQTKSGNSERAVVLTGLVGLQDQTAGDYKLVVGKSGTALQEKVAGIRCGDIDLDAFNGSPASGTGVLVIPHGDEKVVSEVIKVANVIFDTEGNTTVLIDDPFLGRVSAVIPTQQHSPRKMVKTASAQTLLPWGTKFLPVSVSDVKYGDDPDLMVKISSRVAYLNEVTLRQEEDDSFSLHGRDVFPARYRNETDLAHSLCLLGDTDGGAKQKIASAKVGNAVKFVATRRLPTPNMEKTASPVKDQKALAAFADLIRVDLVKEAASLNNTDTVDSVLSLNFVTPENLQNYIDAVPDLEEASQKLAELLIGVRLGVTDVPEAAVSSALSGLERALTGLKKLQLRAGAAAS